MRRRVAIIGCGIGLLIKKITSQNNACICSPIFANCPRNWPCVLLSQKHTFKIVPAIGSHSGAGIYKAPITIWEKCMVQMFHHPSPYYFPLGIVLLTIIMSFTDMVYCASFFFYWTYLRWTIRRTKAWDIIIFVLHTQLHFHQYFC